MTARSTLGIVAGSAALLGVLSQSCAFAQGAFPAPLPGASSAAPASASPFPPVNGSGGGAAASPFPPAGGSSAFPSGGAAPIGGGMGMPQPQPQAQGEPPCIKEFMSYKDQFAKRAHAFQAATSAKTKPTAQEACKLISSLSDTAQRWRKYTEAKGASCGIPDQVTTQLKTQQTQVATAQKNICNAAAQQAAGGGGPAQPSLSEALGGGAMLPEAPTTTKRAGGGTFDTISGNVLSR